jgi:hypothetical protein
MKHHSTFPWHSNSIAAPNRTRRWLGFLLCASLAVLAACSSVPKTFVESTDSGWKSIAYPDSLTTEEAWDIVSDELIKRFDIEAIDKGSGYARTAWSHNWGGALNEKYRVRVAVKLNTTHHQLDIKTEAQYGGAGNWVQGQDTALLNDIYTDLTGKMSKMK